MPPRPTGTDGSDHSYREVIVERYKRMADFNDAIHKLMGLHLVFALLKLAWSFAVFRVAGIPMPLNFVGIAVGEVVLRGVLRAAKLGQSRESLPLLKAFNMLQAFMTAAAVLGSWQYHMGTMTQGVATYPNAHAVARYLQATAPVLPGNVLDLLKAAELFLDATLSAFLFLATFVTHKMLVEKMQMKAEKGAALAKQRKGAIRGGGDSDDSEASDSEDEDDDGGAPQAVPLHQEAPKPKVAKVAAASSIRRRHA